MHTIPTLDFLMIIISNNRLDDAYFSCIDLHLVWGTPQWGRGGDRRPEGDGWGTKAGELFWMRKIT